MHVADNAQMALSPETVLTRTVVKARPKDSVALLARRYNVSVSNVAQWNKISASAALANKQSIVLFLPVKAKIAGKSNVHKNRTATARSKSRPIRTAAKSSGRKFKKS
jgi:membrane-bound lytic murein transglycosylase D